MASQPAQFAPVIATGKVFAHYLDAARSNLENMAVLARNLRDAEFAEEAQRLLDNYDMCAADCRALIDAANREAA